MGWKIPNKYWLGPKRQICFGLFVSINVQKNQCSKSSYISVQERRVIWPKEKDKFFTYPCLTLCCFKYDHKKGVIAYGSIMALLCVIIIITLVVFRSEVPKFEAQFLFALPDHFFMLAFFLLGLNVLLHIALVVGAWRHSSLWIAPWLTIFGAETLLLLALSIQYSLASFLDANYELLVVASIGLILWGKPLQSLKLVFLWFTYVQNLA